VAAVLARQVPDDVELLASLHQSDHSLRHRSAAVVVVATTTATWVLMAVQAVVVATIQLQAELELQVKVTMADAVIQRDLQAVAAVKLRPVQMRQGLT
jgi:hypothetical protein